VADPNSETGSSGTGEGAGTNEIRDAVVGAIVQAQSIHGDINFNLPRPVIRVKPAQLPSCPPYFTNRQRELETLQRLVAESDEQGQRLVVVITGQGGVGKTSLGLCWLHKISVQYGDGQLYLDLQGFSGVAHVSASEALASFLRALGVAAEDVPLAVEEQSALFRSLTAGRRLILVLDNAVSAAQVRPLLPGNGPMIVMVTTRLRLSGLAVDGASFLEVDPLDEDGALDLLARMLGADRTSAERKEARLLANLCGRLPLALCTSAARLSVRRRWSIARLVSELSDERRRLAAMRNEDDPSVRAVFDASYGALPTDAARLYRMLGLHPGRDFDVSLAAAVAQVDENEAARVLDVLVSASLVQEDASGRFRFHDLLRLHARSIAEDAEPADVRDSALRRIVEHYLDFAAAADLRMIPGRWRLGSHYEVNEQIARFDRASALAWLESELPNLAAALRLAYDQELYRQAWEICEALWALFVYRKHYRVWLDTHQIGLDAARACADQLAEARMLEQLGSAYLNLKNFQAAATHASRAVQLERLNDHPVGEATALEVRGIAEMELGQPREAIDTFTKSKMLNDRVGMRRGVAIMNRRLGDALSVVGRIEESIEHLIGARSFFAADNDPYNEMRTLTSLARVYSDASQFENAEAALRTALSVSQSIGATKETANVYLVLARVAARLSNRDQERRYLQSALTMYEAMGAPEVEEVRVLLGDISPDG
jgi:tetratricopeptide (TPR) repeat protein